MTRCEVFQACHQPEETYSAWLTASPLEWAFLSGCTDKLARGRCSGWRFPILVSQAHHAAFDRFLHNWLATTNELKDRQ
jgi:hypothetical protein